MKVLVTGAAGFIGFHLVNALLDKELEVVGVDNINDYYDVQLKHDRLLQAGIPVDKIVKTSSSSYTTSNLLQSNCHLKYRFLKIDITDLKALEELCKIEQFDCIVNLAAQAGVRYSIENPHTYVQSNVVGFLNILECCRNMNVNHLIYASSSSVYGNRTKIPFSEDQMVDSPVSLYAATKKANELMAHAYSHLYNFKTTGLRFFTVYGPWGRPDMAPMLFADAIHNKRAVKVFNNGEMQRDFTYVDDVVEGVVRLVMIDTIEDSLKSNVYNIGSSKPVKLMDFISGLEREIGQVATKDFLPMQDGDVTITYADSRKLKDAIGYEPTTNLTTGLYNFVKWFKDYYIKRNN